jgi:hypothetical protein
MMASNSSFDSYPGIMMPGDVASGALANLGRGLAWVAGSGESRSREAAGVRAAHRLINSMTEACAELYDLPFVSVEGIDRGEFE